ncbi:helix-turn-helix domain-containing protein [uncultured Kordia sp.]|uniref:helix-turn-helix domain-containing protein n=1 Tax=uncultured Kordia sp. TaxID=507699 RepID=UPI002606FD91|nr:helix-turn-helix domain-containing protein [uncultured Kordia sp.]
MNQKPPYFLFLFLCFSINTFLNAQPQNDSLAKYDYKELRALRKKHQYSNLKLTKIYIDRYLELAKKNNDTIRISYGFFFLSHYYGVEKDKKKALNFLDSVIVYSIGRNDKYQPALAYKNKGVYLYEQGGNKRAIGNFFKALQVLKTNKNVLLELEVRNAIIVLKTNWRANEETLNFQKENIQFVINNKDSILDFEKTYLYALGNLSKEYIRNKKYKEGLETIFKGILESIKYKDTLEYYDFVSNAGAAYYYLKNYQTAIDSLQKALPYESYHGKAMGNYYLGKSYDKLNQPEKAQIHFLKTDSIYQVTKDIFPEMRIAYEHIIDYYKSKNDTENQIKYYDRLIETDKIIDSTYTYVANTIEKKFDTPQAIAERARLVEEAKANENSWKYSFGIISAALLAISGVLFYVYRRQKYYKQRFENIMSAEVLEAQKQKDTSAPLIVDSEILEAHSEALEAHSEALEEKDIGISETIVKSILKGLSKFEASKGCRKQVTLTALAKNLETNPKYLSKVINWHYEKNFTSYINELRVQYAILKLKEEAVFRNYTIKAIAQEVGFKSAESFSKTFYKVTGIYPSYFVKQLNKYQNS